MVDVYQQHKPQAPLEAHFSAVYKQTAHVGRVCLAYINNGAVCVKQVADILANCFLQLRLHIAFNQRRGEISVQYPYVGEKSERLG